MTVMPLGAKGIAIFLDPDELRSAGVEADELSVERARPIVVTAMRESGLDPDGSLEIESFCNGEGVLLFARIVPTRPVFIVFGGLEDLLGAVKSLVEPPGGSELTYLDGRYWLTLTGEARSLVPLLSEFGEESNCEPEYVHFLREHGQVIIERDAISNLRAYFS
ncbi:MAG: adaptor protein MecA [Oscillospiraceae bacterium]|jgi:hypothetical protein